MSREVITEVVQRVVFDTGEATRAAKRLAQQQDELAAASKRLTAQERQLERSQKELREESLKLRRESIQLGVDKKQLAKRSAEVRLELAQQAEAARQARTAQKGLRDEQRALAAEMRNTAKAAKEAARAEAQAAREIEASRRRIARHNASADRSAARLGAVFDRQASDRRSREMGRLNASISERRGNIRELENRIETEREKSIGGVLRRRARERFSNEALVGDVGALPGAIGGAARAGVGAAAGIVGLGATAVGGIASIGSEFEKLRTSLETIEGSKTRAEETFNVIKQFALETPYGLQETTGALVKLKARGLDASLPALKAYGDTASAMGKSLDDMVEAVADAATGEFERLKEFGIKASSQGDKVALTFKGVTTTVDKNAKAIEQHLIQLGQTNFGGGMERQSKTLSGQLAQLGDAASSLADEAFRSGLGDALKDVVADMAGLTGEGGDLAKVIGKTLGDAVRSAWRAVKDFIGPTDQLGDKFQKAYKLGSDFVSMVTSAIKTAVDFASSIGGAETAVVALGVALVALGGPLGAAVGLGVTLGATLVSAFTDSKEALAKLRKEAQAVRDDEYKAQRDALQQEIDQTRRENQQLERANAAGMRVREIELRRLGKTVDQLTPEERANLRRKVMGTIQGLRGEGTTGARAFGGGDFDSRLEAFNASTTDLEHSADEAEFGRLRKKKNLTPSEKKRLGELSKRLDVDAKKPKTAKEKLDAFDAQRKQEIEELARKAELRAGDEALARGDVAGASSAAKAAGKETRDRLKAQLAQGIALPGEVERSLLRAAGFEDVKNTPPPPVVVYQQQFTFNVEVPITADIVAEGSADSVGADIAAAIDTHLEVDVLPQAYEKFRTTIRR